MIKGFLFDLDGTLVDTHQANFRAYQLALADFGFDLTYDEFKRSIGYQAQVFLRWFAGGLKDSDYLVMAKKKAKYYPGCLHHSVINTGLIGFINEIKPSAATAVVTTAKRENAQNVLRYHQIDHLFDHLVCADNVRNPKPDPEAYLHALTLVGIKPSEALAFEDSEVGIQSAEAARIAVVRISSFIP